MFCGQTIHPTAEMSEEVNRNKEVPSYEYPTTVQFNNPYTDPERHEAHRRHRQTDRQTDHSMIPIAAV